MLNKAGAYLKDAKSDLRKELAGAVYACFGTRLTGDTDASPHGYGLKPMSLRKDYSDAAKPGRVTVRLMQSQEINKKHRLEAIESGKLQQNFDQAEKERKFGKDAARLRDMKNRLAGSSMIPRKITPVDGATTTTPRDAVTVKSKWGIVR